MALIALDPCDLALAQSGKDNVVLKVGNVDGFPGIEFAVPMSRETAEAVYEGLGKIVQNFPAIVETATVDQAAREAAKHGLDPTAR